MKNVTLYKYLDITNPLVEWEVAIGRICSSYHIDEGKFGVSLWCYNNLKNKTSQDKLVEVVNEFNLESIRRNFYQAAVSRLRGVFFFETEDMLKAAFAHWGKSYNPQYVSPVNFSASNLTKVDSEWISQKLGSHDDGDEWMHRYWRGESYWENPVTEVIASGIGFVTNNKLRELAYMRICEREPHVSKLLAFSAAKFFYGIENAGLTIPAVVYEQGELVGDYYIDMRPFENGASPKMDEVLKHCREHGAVFPYNDICDKSGVIRVGDFKGKFVLKSKEVQAAYNSAHGI